MAAHLEARVLVSVGPVRNAMARLFQAWGAFDAGVEEFRDDTMLFAMTDGRLSVPGLPLPYAYASAYARPQWG